jgi:hypothetical protein
MAERKFVGDSFSVSVVEVFRELVRVIYIRDGNITALDGEHISGSEPRNLHGGIAVRIPQSVVPDKVPEMVKDLCEGLNGLEYGYFIDRLTGFETVPDSERNAAIDEMREMGYEIEMLANGTIRQTPMPNVPRQDMETAKSQGVRMGALIESIRGKRPQFEVLARSKGY